jgi:hypothetical protein
MRNVIILSIALFCLCCSKDEDTSIIGSGDLTMKINGVSWSGTLITNSVDEDTEQAALSSVNVSSNETMGIVIDDLTGVGTYPIPGDNVSGALYLRKDKVHFTAGSEIIYKVTSIEGSVGSKKVHGTFSGTMKSTAGDVFTITEGKFLTNINSCLLLILNA